MIVFTEPKKEKLEDTKLLKADQGKVQKALDGIYKEYMKEIEAQEKAAEKAAKGSQASLRSKRSK